jgi:hypothetical protein
MFFGMNDNGSERRRRCAALVVGILALAVAAGLAACGETGKHAATEARAPADAPRATTTPGRSASSGSPSPAASQGRSDSVVREGLPHVRLPQGSLPLADGDVDNFKDTDHDVPISDKSVDTDEDIQVQEGPKFPDRDDSFVLNVGRGATKAEGRALSGLVARYVAAERAGHWAGVCAMLLPAVAASLPSEVSRSGEGCPAAASAALAHSHRLLAAPAKVVDVRILGQAAEVVVGSQTMPASLLLLRRSGRSWAFDELLGHPLA